MSPCTPYHVINWTYIWLWVVTMWSTPVVRNASTQLEAKQYNFRWVQGRYLLWLRSRVKCQTAQNVRSSGSRPKQVCFFPEVLFRYKILYMGLICSSDVRLHVILLYQCIGPSWPLLSKLETSESWQFRNSQDVYSSNNDSSALTSPDILQKFFWPRWSQNPPVLLSQKTL